MVTTERRPAAARRALRAGAWPRGIVPLVLAVGAPGALPLWRPGAPA